MIIVLILLVVLFCAGGFGYHGGYLGGTAGYGGMWGGGISLLGIILIICVVLLLTGRL